MADEPTDGQSTVVSAIEEARLVYGTVLVDGTPQLVECIDNDAFDAQPAIEMATATAATSITADLIPLVEGVEEPTDLLELAGEGPQLTSFAELTDELSTATAYYLLVNIGGDNWKRIRNAARGTFEVGSEIAGPEDSRYRVAAPLVDDARDRIANLPESVDGTEIHIIDWG